MQLWTMVFNGRRYGPYPWALMRRVIRNVHGREARRVRAS